MAITLTDIAAQRMKRVLTEHDYEALRLGVKSAGCSGMSYVMDFEDDIEDDDAVFEEKGVKIVVASDSLQYLDGMEVDYAKQGLNEGFVFNNPNAKASCGCGDSFSV